MVGGDLEFIPDWDEMLARSLELIDAQARGAQAQAVRPGAVRRQRRQPVLQRHQGVPRREGERGRGRRHGRRLGRVPARRGPLARPRRRARPRPRRRRRAAARARPRADWRGDGGLMSRYIATRAIRGARRIVAEADEALQAAARRARPRDAGRLHQHRLLPAGDLRLHRREGRDPRRPRRPCSSAPRASCTRCPTSRCGCRTWARPSTPASPRCSPRRRSRACASRRASSRRPSSSRARPPRTSASRSRRPTCTATSCASTGPSTTSSSAPGASSSSTAACPGSAPSSAAPSRTRSPSRSSASCSRAASSSSSAAT